MKKFITAIVVIALVACTCAATFFVSQWYFSKHKYDAYTEAPSPTDNSDMLDSIIQEEVLVSGETVESGIKAIGELCTAEYYYTHVEVEESRAQINLIITQFHLPGTTSSFIYQINGKVLAGINFENVVVDVDNDNKVVNITLPHAEVITSEIDTDSYKVFSEKNNIFNPIQVDNVMETYDHVDQDEKSKAIEAGLLSRAEDNAVTLLNGFVSNLINNDDYNYKVQFND